MRTADGLQLTAYSQPLDTCVLHAYYPAMRTADGRRLTAGGCEQGGALRTILLAALLMLLLSSCSTPYYERAIDPPGFSRGVGAAAKVFLVVENDEEWYYACGPVFTGYVRQRRAGRLSLSAQLDLEHALPVPGSHSYWTGYSITSGSLIGGLKVATWRRAAVKLNAGVIGEMVKKKQRLFFGAAPLLDVALLQDFWDRNPLTGRVSFGTGGLQFGVGWEFPLSNSLTGRLSAGTELLSLGMPYFMPPPLGAHVGFAIEPRRAE